MGGVADDPFWLERWLLPDVMREGEVFESMLEAVEGRLKLLDSSWREMQREPGCPDEAADELAEEGTSAVAMRVDIAEIALTAIFHWVERRCTLLLLRKAAAKHDDAKTIEKLAKDDFRKKVNGLKVRGVELASQPHFALIDSALREFANSWKHRDEPKPELLAALGLVGPPPVELLKDDALRKVMAAAVGIRADSDPGDIVRAFARAAAEFLRAVYRAAYPRPAR
jgi:hypothetical protein